MCKYCNANPGDSPDLAIIDEPISLGIFGNDSILVDLYRKENGDDVLFAGVGNDGKSVLINYCPMCGRKLNEVADETD